MDKILQKYGLQERIILDSEIPLDRIVQKMVSESNGEYYSFLFVFLDFAQPKYQKLVGEVSEKGFRVRKRIGFFDFFPNWAKATGNFVSSERGTEISITIDGMSKMFLLMELIILTILFLMSALIIFEALIPPIGDVNPFSDLFILMVIGFFFVLVPILHTKWNIRRIKRDLNQYFE